MYKTVHDWYKSSMMEQKNFAPSVKDMLGGIGVSA